MYLNNPNYIEIEDRRYKINTDYRIALRCNEIAQDTDIGDYERGFAIIYLLFGDEGLHEKDTNKLLELAIKYLQCGEERTIKKTSEIDMDLVQDFPLIVASFKSDYNIDLLNAKMHWWDFFMYLNGLTDKCILNRVREIRTMDLKGIKDIKEKSRLENAKRQFELRPKKQKTTEEQKKSANTFYELTGLKRK